MTGLFAGRLLSVDDWCCAGDDSPGGHAEWCADDRIVITRRGVWELAVEGAPRLADASMATLWNRNTEYRVRHPVRGGDQCTLFRLTAAGTRALREARDARQPGRPAASTFARHSLSLDGSAYLLHRRVLSAARRGQGSLDRLAVEESAFELVRSLTLSADPESDSPASHQELVSRVREIIARDFAGPLTVETIAEAVGCSPFHLSRLFRRGTGLTLHRAIVRLRLREGLERLLDEPQHISRIALDVGFASHSHFTDAFRAEYGYSPRQVRFLPSFQQEAP